MIEDGYLEHKYISYFDWMTKKTGDPDQSSELEKIKNSSTTVPDAMKNFYLT